MKALLQRVTKASVSVDGHITGKIDAGLVILLGVQNGDSVEDAKYLAEKCANLRIFADEKGKFSHSLRDVKGEALVVSQFTLYGDTSKGRRPNFSAAAPPETSKPLYEKFMNALSVLEINVESGAFGAMMLLELRNDGPVTLMIESKSK